jgi:hypothetical protein
MSSDVAEDDRELAVGEREDVVEVAAGPRSLRGPVRGRGPDRAKSRRRLGQQRRLQQTDVVEQLVALDFQTPGATRGEPGARGGYEHKEQQDAHHQADRHGHDDDLASLAIGAEPPGFGASLLRGRALWRPVSELASGERREGEDRRGRASWQRASARARGGTLASSTERLGVADSAPGRGRRIATGKLTASVAAAARERRRGSLRAVPRRPLRHMRSARRGPRGFDGVRLLALGALAPRAGALAVPRVAAAGVPPRTPSIPGWRVRRARATRAAATQGLSSARGVSARFEHGRGDGDGRTRRWRAGRRG